MDDRADFAEQLLRSPAGVALLHSLELEHRRDVAWFDFPSDSQALAVRDAAVSVKAMQFGELVQGIVAAAEHVGGPWVSNSPAQLANAFRMAPDRRAIAVAVADRFAGMLRADLGGVQEWWSSRSDGARVGQLFRHHDAVYCCGEFTWAGLWTVSAPPPEVHDDLVNVWELYPGPISRWRMPINPGARVFEIHAAADWVRFVAAFPRRTTEMHGGWELPGSNQERGYTGAAELIALGLAAGRDADVVMPDWSQVAAAYDGVHLSWAGMLTSEGNVVRVPELGPKAVTMLRYWGSERTLWLNDVFGSPEPLPAPALLGESSGLGSVDIMLDAGRAAADRRVLTTLLGRELWIQRDLLRVCSPRELNDGDDGLLIVQGDDRQ